MKRKENMLKLLPDKKEIDVFQKERYSISCDNYYPFGLAFNSYQRSTAVPDKFLFNGIERQDELDLGLYDYLPHSSSFVTRTREERQSIYPNCKLLEYLY